MVYWPPQYAAFVVEMCTNIWSSASFGNTHIYTHSTRCWLHQTTMWHWPFFPKMGVSFMSKEIFPKMWSLWASSLNL